MNKNCCIPLCTKNYNCSTFGVPKNVMQLWETSLGMNLKYNSRVCEKHFKPEDIITEWVSGSGVNKYSICLKRPKLCVGAIPTSHSTLLETHKIVNIPTILNIIQHFSYLVLNTRLYTLWDTLLEATYCVDNINDAKNNELNLLKKRKNIEDIHNDHCYSSSHCYMSSVIPENTFSIDNAQSISLKKIKKLIPEAGPTEALFTDILKNIKLVS